MQGWFSWSIFGPASFLFITFLTMVKVIKSLIKVGAVAVLMYTTAPFLGVLAVTYFSLKGVEILANAFDFFRDRRLRSRAQVSDEQIKKNRQLHKVNSKKRFFNWRRNEWDLSQFPLDMYPTVGVKGKVSEFTCAGIPNIVHAEARGRKSAEFHLVLKDEHKARMIVDHIERNAVIGTRVERVKDLYGDGYSFKVISDNAVDINEIVRQFYPPKKFEVSRRHEVTHQFVIDGCSSYEEALEKFQKERFRYTDWEAANTYTVIQDTVNGVKGNPEKYGEPLDTTVLGVGQYIINETSWEVYSKNVTINGDVDRTEEDLRSVASEEFVSSAENLVEDQCSAEPVLSNALDGKDVERTIVSVDGHVMKLLHEDSPELNVAGLNMVMKFSSIEEMMAVVANPSSLVDRPVLIDTVPMYSSEESTPKEGEYMLYVPVDRNMLLSLESKAYEAGQTFAKYHEMGVSESDIRLTYMMNQLRRDGFATAYVTDIPDFSQAKINGVTVEEFTKRIEQRQLLDVFENMSEMEKETRSRSWMQEMSQVLSVDMSVDIKRKELVMVIDVKNPDNSVTNRRVTRTLNDSEMEAMATRGRIGDTELKDLVLRTFPSYFKTYSNEGKAMFVDPVGDFIMNRKPKTVAEAEAEAKALKKSAAEEAKHVAERKKLASAKMKV